MNDQHHEILAAVVRRRFGDDAVAAWKRLFQNDGWDDSIGIAEWHAMAERGDRFLNSVGVRAEDK